MNKVIVFFAVLICVSLGMTDDSFARSKSGSSGKSSATGGTAKCKSAQCFKKHPSGTYHYLKKNKR